MVMYENKAQFHGSDLEKVEQIYGIPKEEIVCFSGNVNPLGISSKLRKTLADKIDVIESYPDREYTSLRKHMADYVGTDPRRILVGNGSTELISLFIQALAPKKALTLSPTYSEYDREISLVGGRIYSFPLTEGEDEYYVDVPALLDELRSDVDLLILCNPNNPTSSLIKREEMHKILSACEDLSVTVMVDETYIEFTESPADTSAVPLTAKYRDLIVLRGVSKYFAAPGLRLGYAICGDIEKLDALRLTQNPWSISSLAAAAGEIIFTDDEYISRTHDLITTERERVCEELKKNPDYQVFRAHANFVLVKILNPSISSGSLFEKAIREHMMIRDCSDFASLNDRYIRFCFLTPKQNDMLLSCLNDG